MKYPAVLRRCPRVALALAEAQALTQATNSRVSQYNFTYLSPQEAGNITR